MPTIAFSNPKSIGQTGSGLISIGKTVTLARSMASALLTSLVFTGCFLGATKQAQATAFCNFKPTHDGFVALRDRPSPKSKLLGRMKPGDEVLIGVGEKGNWIEVTWWKGQDRFEKGYGHTSGHGWVNSRLIEEEC